MWKPHHTLYAYGGRYNLGKLAMDMGINPSTLRRQFNINDRLNFPLAHSVKLLEATAHQRPDQKPDLTLLDDIELHFGRVAVEIPEADDLNLDVKAIHQMCRESNEAINMLLKAIDDEVVTSDEAKESLGLVIKSLRRHLDIAHKLRKIIKGDK